MATGIRQGRLLVIITISILIFCEVIGCIFLTKNDRWSTSHVCRVITTLALLWNLWDGARWARWVTVLCLLAATGFVIYFMVTNTKLIQQRPDAGVIIGSLGLMSLILGAVLSTPWVTAFLQHQRDRKQVNHQHSDLNSSKITISNSENGTPVELK